MDYFQKLVVGQELAWKEDGYIHNYEHEDGTFATSEFITNGHKYHNWYRMAKKLWNGGNVIKLTSNFINEA